MLTRKLLTLANKYIDSYNNYSYDISTNGEMAILCKLRELKTLAMCVLMLALTKENGQKTL